MAIKPKSVPQQKPSETIRILEENGVKDMCAILAVRGYYKDTMGSAGVNDRAMYDDALFLVGNSFYGSFNANTDPGAYRRGHGSGSAKGMASLKEGVYRVHKIDIHGGSVPHLALCQRAGPVTVLRDADSSVPNSKIVMLDGKPCYEDTGNFGINIHRGGLNKTSSIGCITIFPEQWAYFIAKAQEQMKLAGQSVMPLCLVHA